MQRRDQTLDNGENVATAEILNKGTWPLLRNGAGRVA